MAQWLYCTLTHCILARCTIAGTIVFRSVRNNDGVCRLRLYGIGVDALGPEAEQVVSGRYDCPNIGPVRFLIGVMTEHIAKIAQN
jgi:hypothetical protein